eukprot:jgi/Undpi1/10508/HiC_scaffold_29.g12958.m1
MSVVLPRWWWRICCPLSLTTTRAPLLLLPRYRSTCAWIWFRCKGGGGYNKDNDNCDDGGEVGSATAIKLAPPLPTETDGGSIRVPSWMEAVAAPVATMQNGSGHDAERLGDKARDSKPKSLLLQEHIRILLFIDALYALTYSGLEAVFTLWALSSIANGGLDWSALDIGQVFFACGLLLLVFELVFVPFITPLWGIRFCQRLGSVVEVPIYFVIPLLTHMSNTGVPVRMAAVALLFTFLACTDPFYIGVSLAVNNATGPDRRGEMNGIYMTTTSISRAISPVFASMLFAWSIDVSLPFPFDYHLAFYFLALIRLTVACLGWNRICDNGAVGRNRMIFGE